MRKTRGQKKSKKTVSGRDAERIPRPFAAQRKQDAIARPQNLYICLSYATTTVGATGATLANTIDSSNVGSCTEWSVMAGVWGEYRVISITMCVQLFFNVVDAKDLTAGGTGGYPGPMVSCAFGEQTISGGYINIIDNPGLRFHSVGRDFQVKIAAVAVNPFALEWTATSAAPPAAQQFGVVSDSAVACPAAFNGIPVAITTFRFDIEFRGRR